MKKNPATATAVSAVSALLGGKAPKKKSAKKKATKTLHKLPSELAGLADVVAAGRTFVKVAKKKLDLAEARFKAHALGIWAREFIDTGKKPSMSTFEGVESSVGFIQTKRIHLSSEKMEMLDCLGVNISDHVETKGIKVDMEAVAKLGYMEKLTELLTEMVGENEEHLAEIFEPQVGVKEGLFERLPEIVQSSCGRGEDPVEKLVQVIEALGAVSQIKNAEIPRDPAGCFDLVMNTKVSSDS